MHFIKLTAVALASVVVLAGSAGCQTEVVEADGPVAKDEAKFIAGVMIKTSNGLCLDIEGGSYAPGARVVQWPCHGGRNQRFNIHQFGDGSVAIENVQSTLCLDVQGGSRAWGAKVIQYNCYFTTNQLWRLQPDCFWNVNSHLCLDVPDNSSNWFLQMQQWPWNQNSAQRFEFAY